MVEILNTGLRDYYRCPDKFEHFGLRDPRPTTSGYFRFGRDSICFGEFHGQEPSSDCIDALVDALPDVSIDDGTVYLPFDPAQVIANLGREAYVGEWRGGAQSGITNLYYWLRPVLPVAVRRYLQKFHLRDWNKLTFPRWPVDCSMDNLLEELLRLALRASKDDCVPFIWFWPDACSSCALMTHDVETKSGMDFCSTLMDIDESFGVKASFQIIPEDRYKVGAGFLDEIRWRGFEICIHDLNHDGHLYKSRKQFLERALKINAYAKEMGAEGFRAGALYRRQIWYDELKFAFDMSVPNVAHLDPQRGGCCTVMPYFLNGILEIPVTTVQDYTLFHILHDYSIDLWKQQMQIILGKHGLMSFIVHPDYVATSRELRVYNELLTYLVKLRQDQNVWVTTPGEINRWWRQRAALQLVEGSEGWHIEGSGSERACIAYAREERGRVVFSFDRRGGNSADALTGHRSEAVAH